MKNQYRYSLLHFSFFFGALVLQNEIIFFAFAVVAGLLPRFKYRFGYYTLLATLAMILAFYLKESYDPLINTFDEILELRNISLNWLIGIVTVLSLGLVARASNELLHLLSPAKRQSKEEDQDEIDADLDEFGDEDNYEKELKYKP